MDCILSNVFYLGWAGFYSYSYSYFYFLFFHAIHRYVLSAYFTIHRFSLYLFALSSVIPLSLLLISSPCAVRPRLWREQRRVMFGLSVWLLVSVSGAAGSSDSAGGAAGPSRVQPSPCDTLSVTDPSVWWHGIPSSSPVLVFAHHSTTVPPPPAASGLFTATLQSVAQSVTNCLMPHWGLFSRSWPTCVLKADTKIFELIRFSWLSPSATSTRRANHPSSLTAYNVQTLQKKPWRWKPIS